MRKHPVVRALAWFMPRNVTGWVVVAIQVVLFIVVDLGFRLAGVELNLVGWIILIVSGLIDCGVATQLANRDINWFRAKIAAHKAKIEAHKAEIEAHKAKIETHKEEIEAHKAEAAAHKAKAADHEAEIAELKKQVRLLQQPPGPMPNNRDSVSSAS
jgi:hypothetical protein